MIQRNKYHLIEVLADTMGTLRQQEYAFGGVVLTLIEGTAQILL